MNPHLIWGVAFAFIFGLWILTFGLLIVTSHFLTSAIADLDAATGSHGLHGGGDGEPQHED
jgi:hypothetical protein